MTNMKLENPPICGPIRVLKLYGAQYRQPKYNSHCNSITKTVSHTLLAYHICASHTSLPSPSLPLAHLGTIAPPLTACTSRRMQFSFPIELNIVKIIVAQPI